MRTRVVSQSAAQDLRHMILVVDDHVDTCEAVSRLLTAAGLSAQYATSGPEALELLGTAIPQLILLDIMMPGMSGIELLRLVRTNPRTAGVPVLMMTATSDERDLEEAVRLGVKGIIPKGRFDWSHLLDRVRSCMA